MPALARLRRRPVAWWLATVVLAALTAQVVSGAVAGAERAAARYGRTRPALVVTSDVAAGSEVTGTVAEVRDVPSALVPAGAVGADALGRRAGVPLFAGEVVVGDRLAPVGRAAVAARLPAGTRGVGVPSGPDSVPLAPGDVVDVLATVLGAGAGGSAPPTVTVARGAVVVAVEEGAATVAVPLADAPRVAYAVASGIVTLALVGG